MAYDMGMQARTVKSTILQSRVDHIAIYRAGFFKIFTPAGWLLGIEARTALRGSVKHVLSVARFRGRQRCSFVLSPMFDLPMPAPYHGWDPLLQRYVVAGDAVPHAFCPATPASVAAASGGSKTPVTPGTGGSAVLMPPPPPRMATGRPSSFGVVETPAPAAGTTAPAGAAPPQTPEEISEAQSLALALQLQQEEHAAFMQAVRVSSPAPQSATGGAHGEPMVDDEMDESLQLAMQLQQEELQWHAAAAGAAAGDDIDEDVRLAMRLAAEQDEDH